MKQQQKKMNQKLTRHIQENFRKAGTIIIFKDQEELLIAGKQVSRRRIGRIMKQEGLVSSYTTAQFKPQKRQM